MYSNRWEHMTIPEITIRMDAVEHSCFIKE
jgi:hypothetical protein